MTVSRTGFSTAALVVFLVHISDGATNKASAQEAGGLAGTVKIDGSSTVAPITKAAAELFRAKQPNVKTSVGISGTGGGFKKFLEENAGLRTDVNDASRPILPEEQARAKSLGVEYLELPIAYDGMAVIVHPSNNFCDSLTIGELKRIWQPDSKINNWKDVRQGFPDLPLKLYGPGTDSGTFDYFTEVVCGKAKACRSDFTPSEDDNMLVTGVAGDKGSLGYFGFSYFEANKNRLKLLGIDNGNGKVIKPSEETVRSLAYAPLARPLYLYVNAESAKRPEVRAFLDYFFADPAKIVAHQRVNYIPLSDKLYAAVRDRLAKGTKGTLYPDTASHTKSLYDLYGVEHH